MLLTRDLWLSDPYLRLEYEGVQRSRAQFLPSCLHTPASSLAGLVAQHCGLMTIRGGA